MHLPQQGGPPAHLHLNLHTCTPAHLHTCTPAPQGQFYGVTLEYRPNPAEPLHGDMTSVKSVVMLVFRDPKNPEDEVIVLIHHLTSCLPDHQVT